MVSCNLDGELMSIVPHPDTGALMAQDYDGRIYSTSLSVSSSIGYTASEKMPFFMRNTPEPVGGLTVYEPESFASYANKVEDWITVQPGDIRSASVALSMKEALPSIRNQANLREK